MKMSQEIDAMRVLGIDPFDALVLPRFFALLFSIPILTFVATIAGLLGGMLVTWIVLDLSPAFFFQRILENVGITHFWIGLSKAPVMAAVVAAIGCRQGMDVGGDVESLGRRVTSAVVQAIFTIIVEQAVLAAPLAAAAADELAAWKDREIALARRLRRLSRRLGGAGTCAAGAAPRRLHRQFSGREPRGGGLFELAQPHLKVVSKSRRSSLT